MNAKDKIVKIIDTELSKLILQYENEIKELEKNVELLTAKVSHLEKDNDRLREQLTEAFNVSQTKQKWDTRPQNNPVTYEMIDDWILSTSVDDAISLLTTSEKLIINNNQDMLFYITELLGYNQQVLLQDDREVARRFISLSKRILISNDLIPEEEVDPLISNMFDIISGLQDSPYHEMICEFLIENDEKIFDQILELNVPQIINKFLQMLMVYGLQDQVKNALIHLLDVEWGFLDSSLTKDDFTFLLWYSYLFGFDDYMIDVASISLQWFNQISNDLAFYFYINEDGIKNPDTYKEKVEEFSLCNVFTPYEKDLILKKVETTMKRVLPKKPKNLIYYEKVNVVNREQLTYLIQKYNLTKEKLTLPLFKTQNDSLISNYTEFELFYKDKNEAFILLEEMTSLESKSRPFTVKSKSYDGFLPTDHTVSFPNHDEFSWPSTDVNGSKSNDASFDKTLNENSELKLMGYQISGLTRARRWLILEKAVPQLGLKKVVYTISYNIKLRKGQKNGQEKFQHAITEWEHDLTKLKEKFYKKEFKWPNT
jgi:hypothetical protein